jgi:non-specific serine/threonine protein kinase
MPHQVSAEKWCLEEENDGCILAMEMGLGKTVVSLSVMVKKPIKTLIVMPLSLLSQWEMEIETHTKGFKVAVHHGLARMKKENIKSIEDADIVLTTYNTIWSDFKKDIKDIYDDFERVIIDEVHKLRTRKSKMHIAIREMFYNVENKIFLTGTPVCNGINDIIALFQLLNHTPYNQPSFWKSADLAQKVKIVIELRKKHVLHMKVADTIPDKLPKLEIMDVSSDFERKKQHGMYDGILTGRIATGYKIQKIIKLRQCANEAKLLKFDKDSEFASLDIELSDKLRMVNTILEKIPSGEKIVIFSQWLEMLKILQANITDTRQSVIYHGKMKKEEKDDAIKEFKTNPEIQILFITLKAGSVGLNLNIANNAILVEPYFNAAEENQAMTRIFRIGQTKDVKIYKLQMENTIENWMKQLQQIKRKVTDIIMDDKGTAQDIEKEMDNKKLMSSKYIDNEELEL